MTISPIVRLSDATTGCMHPTVFGATVGKVSTTIELRRAGELVTLQLSVDYLQPHGPVWVCDGGTAWTSGRNDPWDGWLHLAKMLRGLHYDNPNAIWHAWAALNRLVCSFTKQPWVAPVF